MNKSQYLYDKRRGGTGIDESINMQNFILTNLDGPTNDHDSVHKKYVHDVFLPMSGGSMTGEIDMGGNKVINAHDPEQGDDLTIKRWTGANFVTNAPLVNGFLPLSGGTLTGPINFGGRQLLGVGTPTTDHAAVKKKYHDDNLPGQKWKLLAHLIGNETTSTTDLDSEGENSHHHQNGC